MAANITEFVDITIIVGGATPDRFGFDYMHVAEHNITSNRQDGPYADIAEVEAAGFTEGAAPTVYYAASSAFAADNAVDTILIGRKIVTGPLDQVWQQDATGPSYVDQTTNANSAAAGDWVLFPAVEAIGDSVIIGQTVPFTSVTFSSAGGTAGTDGGALALAYEYWNGAAWVALAGVVDGTTMFTIAAGAGQVLSFTQPANWASAVISAGAARYYIQVRITAGSYGVNPLYTSGFITSDASWSAALSAIEAVAGADSWYGHTITSRVQADIEGVASWTESRFHTFLNQSNDATYLAGTAGNVGEVLETAGYKRTMGPLYHLTSSGSANGYADAGWAGRGFGFDLDAPNGRKIWAYKTLNGITFDNITSTQATNIFDVNGNIYGRNKGLSFTSKGTTSFGVPYFFDIQTTIDWLKVRLEEDILALFVGTDVVPYTNAGINLIAAAIKERLEIGVTCGHFSPDEPRVVTVPNVQDVSTADKQDRVLTATCSATFAGAIQKLSLSVNLEF